MEKVNRMEAIEMLAKTVEKCKRDILKLDANKDIPFQVKQDKLLDLRVALHRSQRVLLALCQAELKDMKKVG
jgi:hypothetical protein